MKVSGTKNPKSAGPNVAIVYASNSGNTMRAAELVSAELAAAGYQVALHDVSAVSVASLDPDIWVLGSCTWLRMTDQGPTQGELPEHMHGFIERLVASGRLSGKPCAVFALGRHEYTRFCGAADRLEEAIQQAGGYLLADSLRIDGFIQNNETAVRDWAKGLAHQTTVS